MSRTKIKITQRADGRWQKVYKGSTYYISADYKTKSAAWDAWLALKSTIDSGHDANKPHRASYQNAIERFRLEADFHAERGEHDLAAHKRQRADDLQRRFDHSTTPPAIMPEESPYFLSGDSTGLIWQDRLERQEQATKQGVTLEQYVAQFLDHASVVRKVSLGRRNNIRMQLDCLLNWLGRTTSIETLNAATVQGFYTHVKANQTDVTGFDTWSTFKRFVKWLWGLDLIDLPKNLDSKEYTFPRKRKKIEIISDDDLKSLFAKATERTTLYMLLGLNTAMTQVDIAWLRHENVDWGKGELTYKRKKEEEEENVPTVTYKLWDETFRLLKKHRSEHAEFVLVNRNGKQLKVESETADGKYSKTDNIASRFYHCCTNADVSTSFKYLRKTSATKIDNHGEYRGRHFDSLFLGHAPDTTAGQHYSAKERFPDDVVAWLGTEYGYATNR
jgi:hypothetical protein